MCAEARGPSAVWLCAARPRVARVCVWVGTLWKILLAFGEITCYSELLLSHVARRRLGRSAYYVGARVGASRACRVVDIWGSGAMDAEDARCCSNGC